MRWLGEHAAALRPRRHPALCTGIPGEMRRAERQICVVGGGYSTATATTADPRVATARFLIHSTQPPCNDSDGWGRCHAHAGTIASAHIRKTAPPQASMQLPGLSAARGHTVAVHSQGFLSVDTGRSGVCVSMRLGPEPAVRNSRREDESPRRNRAES
ncbi:hypothetical protein B0H11DRAFT_336973 [Mycena galericulata]|nr:hypothetical protein B0H11DRAFT_336973 [Mycena galericulata]